MFLIRRTLGSYLMGGRRASLSSILQPLVLNMATILCLAIICAITIGTLIVSIGLLTYHLLILQGLSPAVVLVIFSGGEIIMASLIFLWLRDTLRELRSVLYTADPSPRFVIHTRRVGAAFLDGLLQPTH